MIIIIYEKINYYNIDIKDDKNNLRFKHSLPYRYLYLEELKLEQKEVNRLKRHKVYNKETNKNDKKYNIIFNREDKKNYLLHDTKIVSSEERKETVESILKDGFYNLKNEKIEGDILEGISNVEDLIQYYITKEIPKTKSSINFSPVLLFAENLGRYLDYNSDSHGLSSNCIGNLKNQIKISEGFTYRNIDSLDLKHIQKKYPSKKKYKYKKSKFAKHLKETEKMPENRIAEWCVVDTENNFSFADKQFNIDKSMSQYEVTDRGKDMDKILVYYFPDEDDYAFYDLNKDKIDNNKIKTLP